jgi:biofilm PGA synthesis lipoprotein PgaB
VIKPKPLLITVGLITLVLGIGSGGLGDNVGLHGAQVELWTLEEVGVAELVHQVAAAGADTIILRVFDYEDEPNPGVYFQTELAPVKRDILRDLLEQAHAAGLRVFAWMTSLNLPWVLREHPDWAVVGYDWDEERYTADTGWYWRVSPFVPEFIDYLKGLYRDLARYELDGIMFQDDLYLGDNEDFNYYARKAYYERFGRWLRIERLYDDEGNPTAEGQEWIRWKAERLMEVAVQVMDAVRNVNPGMEFGLDAYWETVLEPENGRIWFAQDARLALERGIDHLIVMSYHRSMAEEYGLTVEQALDLLELMTRKGLELVGEVLVMKVQVEDFAEEEALPPEEIEGALAAIKGAGCTNIVYYPHRADLPFELISQYLAD